MIEQMETDSYHVICIMYMVILQVKQQTAHVLLMFAMLLYIFIQIGTYIHFMLLTKYFRYSNICLHCKKHAWALSIYFVDQKVIIE